MTTDTGMVAQCARAICGADGYNEDASWELYVPHARAVLECLRTPTPEMAYVVAKAIAEEFDQALDDLPNSEFMDFISAAKSGIAAYVDAALSPSKGEGE